MENPAIKNYVQSNLAVDTASLMGGPRDGTWVQDTIAYEVLGMPPPKQP